MIGVSSKHLWWSIPIRHYVPVDWQIVEKKRNFLLVSSYWWPSEFPAECNFIQLANIMLVALLFCSWVYEVQHSWDCSCLLSNSLVALRHRSLLLCKYECEFIRCLYRRLPNAVSCSISFNFFIMHYRIILLCYHNASYCIIPWESSTWKLRWFLDLLSELQKLLVHFKIARSVSV